MKPEGLDPHLDGLSSPAEQAAFERELARDPALAAQAALQRRIDAALGRRFAPPGGLAPMSAPSSVPAPRGVAAHRGAWLAAAAALLLGLALGLALLRPEQRSPQEVARAPDAAAQPQADPGTAPAAGEELSPLPALPDLERLYARLAGPGGPLGPAGSSAGELDLSSELALRYDACFDLGAPSCALLGPYSAPEWPSATVLVGYCDGAGRAPSLLVVDDQTMRGCGFAPDTGELLPFYKEVNGLAVWEISPRAEPQLLDAVRSCRD